MELRLRKTAWLILLLAVISCSSTKFTLSEGQVALYVPKNSIVLVRQMPGNSELESQQLFDKMSEKLSSQCIRLLYVPEMQYDFVASGIDMEALFAGDSVNLAKLREWMPRSFFLSVHMGYDRWKNRIGKIDYNEANTNNGYKPTREAGLYTTLQSVSDLTSVWSFKTDTEVDGISYGDVGVNLSGTAIKKAFNKTIAHLDEKSFADCD